MVRQPCLLGTYFRKRGKAAKVVELAALILLGVLLVFRMELLTEIVISALRGGPNDQLETELQLFHPT